MMAGTRCIEQYDHAAIVPDACKWLCRHCSEYQVQHQTTSTHEAAADEDYFHYPCWVQQEVYAWFVVQVQGMSSCVSTCPDYFSDPERALPDFEAESRARLHRRERDFSAYAGVDLKALLTWAWLRYPRARLRWAAPVVLNM